MVECISLFDILIVFIYSCQAAAGSKQLMFCIMDRN